MEDLPFFIENFIKKEKQQRWLFLARQKGTKLAKDLHSIDRQLNTNCQLYRKKAEEIFRKIIEQNKLRDGVYIDKYEGEILIEDLLSYNFTYNDSILICQQDNLAFVFFHEEWLYVCKSKQDSK